VIDPDETPARAALRSAVTDLCAREAPLAAVRVLADDGAPLDRHLFAAMATPGWLTLLADGSDAGGLADAAVVAEVRGATLQPGPFVPHAVAALALVRTGALPEVLTGLRDGSSIATWAWADPSGHWADRPAVRAERAGAGWVLDGVSGLVQDGHQVDQVLVRCHDGMGERAFLVPSGIAGLVLEPLDGLDITRRFARATFDQVPVDPRHEIAGTAEAAHLIPELHLAAVVLGLAETVGAMDRLFAMSVQYAKDRMAFGRPIGSFQAIKHLLADASVGLESSAAMVAAAIRALGDNRPDASQFVHMARSYVADASLDLAHACWQTHGGVAYTWRHDFHLYLRRLTADAALYGDATWHREQLCRAGGI
jgi:alkylation response protein AidB-like acyl-CoA dehydrogenase